jgi:hypothetical protein
LDVVADRGYFNSEEILACEKAGITVTPPKPMTSNSKAEGRFGKQDFRYVPAKSSPTTMRPRKTDWSCAATGPTPAKAAPSSTAAPPERSDGSPDGSMILRRCSTGSTSIQRGCVSGRETVEHPFGTIKARMGATHFLMKTLPRVAAEMALHVLAYNLTRVMNIMGVQPLMAAMRASDDLRRDNAIYRF